jgi:hypothetical protein
MNDAIQNRNVEKIKELVKEGVDPNEIYHTEYYKSSDSALVNAIKENNVEIVEILLNYEKTDVNLNYNYGEYALQACLYSYYNMHNPAFDFDDDDRKNANKIFELVINHKKINLNIFPPPLFYVFIYHIKADEIIDKIINKGGGIGYLNQKYEDDNTVAMLALLPEPDIEISKSNMKLFIALMSINIIAKNNRFKFIEMLCLKGADLTIKNLQGKDCFDMLNYEISINPIWQKNKKGEKLDLSAFKLKLEKIMLKNEIINKMLMFLVSCNKNDKYNKLIEIFKKKNTEKKEKITEKECNGSEEYKLSDEEKTQLVKKAAEKIQKFYRSKKTIREKEKSLEKMDIPDDVIEIVFDFLNEDVKKDGKSKRKSKI